MKIDQIQKLLEARLYCGDDCLNRDVKSVCGCDLMSDVLAYNKDQSMLLTGLVNPQVIRTAVMMDMLCVVFVRSKTPSDEILELARESGIVVMGSDMTMFTACGKLYSNGLVHDARVK